MIRSPFLLFIPLIYSSVNDYSSYTQKKKYNTQYRKEYIKKIRKRQQPMHYDKKDMHHTRRGYSRGRR